jgi:hypothetical protein
LSEGYSAKTKSASNGQEKFGGFHLDINLKVMGKAASRKQQLRVTGALYGPALNKYDYKAIFSWKKG